MEYLNIEHIIAATVVLLGGLCIVFCKHENKPLKLLSFFLVAYMLEYVERSVHAWAVEMLLVLMLVKIPKIVIRDCRWYLLFLLFACISLSYSSHAMRGIPGLFLYAFPLFYYILATVAIRSKSDITQLFTYISNATFFLLVLGLPFYSGRVAYPYYGMAICSIPAVLFLTTKKKIYIIQFLICLLPAIFWVKRTPLLGIAVGMMFFSILLYRWRAVVPIAAALLVGITVIVSIPRFREKMFGGEAIVKSYSGSDNVTDKINTSGRTAFWGIMYEKFHKAAPILGVGQGTVKAYLQSDKNGSGHSFSLMHNDWLLMLCELGIVGTLLLLLFFLEMIWKCIKYSSSQYPKDLRLMAAACMASVTSTMTHMFFENCVNSFVVPTCLALCAILNFYIRSYHSPEGLLLEMPPQSHE